MDVRYLGFDQRASARAYRFDVIEKGEPTRSFIVTAEMALFRTHSVAIQEGPVLCANKLLADLERVPSDAEKPPVAAHELTGDDLRAYSAARIQEDLRRAEMRRNGSRRAAAAARSNNSSPWGRGPVQ